jgi:small subunit ribosomal protein S17
MVSRVAATARKVSRELHGVVTSAGLMQKTVKVRVGGKQWNPRVQQVRAWSFSALLLPNWSVNHGAYPQMLAKPKHYLVHDPNSSLVTGDVVSIVPGWRTSRHKRHVVKHIIAPYGPPIEERPPVPTLEERIAERDEKKRLKDERRAAKGTEHGEPALEPKQKEDSRLKKPKATKLAEEADVD